MANGMPNAVRRAVRVCPFVCPRREASFACVVIPCHAQAFVRMGRVGAHWGGSVGSRVWVGKSEGGLSQTALSLRQQERKCPSQACFPFPFCSHPPRAK